MIEFTGERVVPGKVDSDLWNEHVSRYHFAASLLRGRILDLGCGVGYGSAVLAANGTKVVGIDVAEDAVASANGEFLSAKIEFLQADATCLPVGTAVFDGIAAFEVIEHLADWQSCLDECRRTLHPSGTLIISTPNRIFYERARAEAGPNPFHSHEFTEVEFQTELEDRFDYVQIFRQDHTAAVVIYRGSSVGMARFESASHSTEPNYLIAVCSQQPVEVSQFVFVPEAANLLEQRLEHISKLEDELRQKSTWLRESQSQLQELLNRHRVLERELEEKVQWALREQETVADLAGKLTQMQDDYQALQQNAQSNVSRLEEELTTTANWAQRAQREFDDKCAELARCTDLWQGSERDLTATRAQLEESLLRDQALSLQVNQMQDQLDDLSRWQTSARSSRWMRIGAMLGVGPAR